MNPDKRGIIFAFKTLDGILRKYGESQMRLMDENEQHTRMQHWIIGYLYDHEDEDICQKDVEREFHITPSATSGMLTLMEKKGYIERLRVDGDARRKKLVLTEKAKEIHSRFLEMHRRLDEPLEKAITPEEKEELARLLDKIRTAVLNEMKKNGTEESI